MSSHWRAGFGALEWGPYLSLSLDLSLPSTLLAAEPRICSALGKDFDTFFKIKLREFSRWEKE